MHVFSMIATHYHKGFPAKMLCAVLFIVTGLMGLSMQTLKANRSKQSFHGEKLTIMLNSV